VGFKNGTMKWFKKDKEKEILLLKQMIEVAELNFKHQKELIEYAITRKSKHLSK
jgi:hypothetical protein